MPIQNYSGDYFIHMLEDLYKKSGVQLPQADLDTLKRLVDEEREREEALKAWLRVQDGKVDSRFLDLPVGKIYSEILSADTASLTIKIPPDYNHLLMLSSARTTHAGYNDGILGRFNGDDGANYSEGYDGGQDTSQLAGQSKVQTYFGVSFATGTSATAGATGSSFLFVPHYNSSNWKSVLKVQGTGEYSATDVLTLTTTAHWRNTSKVERITMASGNSANLAAGSIFTVLGIK